MASGFNSIGDVSVTGLVSIEADTIASSVVVAEALIVDGINIFDIIDQLENEIDSNAQSIAQLQADMLTKAGLTSNNTFTGTNIFNNYAPSTPIVPVNSNDLCNKTYVDTKTTLSQVLSNNNTWTGQNTFQKTVSIDDTNFFIYDCYSSINLNGTNTSGPNSMFIERGDVRFTDAPIYADKPITMNGTTDSNRSIQSTYYKLTDFTNNNYIGNINAAPLSLNYDCSINSGTHQFFNRNSAGIQTNTLSVSSTGTVINTNNGSGNIQTLELRDTINNTQLQFNPCAGDNSFNRIVDPLDAAIIARNIAAPSTKGLSIGTWVGRYCGVRITDSTVKMGVGATTAGVSVPTTSITLEENLMTLQSPTPPISTATQPSVTDSSNKIPTTAWVQSTLDNLLAGNNSWTGSNAFNTFLPTSTITPTTSTQLCNKAYVDTKTTSTALLSGNNTWTGTNTFSQNPTCTASQPAISDNTTKLATTQWVQNVLFNRVPRPVNYEVFCSVDTNISGGVTIEYIHESDWAPEDFFIIRVRAQLNTANSNSTPYVWSSYATASGEIIVRPYWDPGFDWGTGTNYQYWPTNNGAQFGVTNNLLYTTGEILNGTNNFIASGNGASQIYISSRNPNRSSGTNNHPFTYTCFVEYISIHTATFRAATVTLYGQSSSNNPHTNYL